MSIRFGCHSSTWVLDYDKESDELDQMIDAVSRAGFQGIDVQTGMLGKYAGAPERLRDKLASAGIELAALTVPFSWEGDAESEDERNRADFYIAYVKHFPNALLNVPARVGPSRDNLLQRQRQIIRCVNALGKRAYENGVVASFHPASPPTSYFRIEEDYKLLFEELDSRYIGYTPDAGHITAGGMNAVEIIRKYLPIVKHVHIKDCSQTFEWKKMGTGDIDFPAIVKVLRDAGYAGWIMVEEETEEAASEPAQVIFDMHDYVENNLLPIANGGRL